MAYERGSESIGIELARLQGWVETTDPELWGRNGEKGLIREFHDDRSERIATMRFIRLMVGVMAALGGLPAIIVLLQLMHIVRP